MLGCGSASLNATAFARSAPAEKSPLAVFYLDMVDHRRDGFASSERGSPVGWR
jgi:hypothetical protein